MKSIRSFSFFLLVLIGSIAFTACKTAPVLTTTEVSAITQTSATSGGNITSDAGSSVISRGVCWSTKANPTIADNKTTDGAGIGSFTSSITGLTAGTTYFVQAYATTSSGTGYGGAYQITTIVATPTVTDADGNTYHTIAIGTQVWMVENLKTTKYNDGTAISNVTDNTAWVALSTPAYCWYNNDATTYKNTYGALYNWYVVNTAKLVPTGWHVPTTDEWTTLVNYVRANLGTTSGYVAKALAATINWTTTTSVVAIGNDLSKNNSSGFSALPGGCRGYDGTFYNIGEFGNWWSSTEYGTTNAWYWILHYRDHGLGESVNAKSYGLSVRCVRD